MACGTVRVETDCVQPVTEHERTARPRSEQRNQQVFGAVVKIHTFLGIDPQDPDTTWRWVEFRAPRNSNHEAEANNRWHLLILIASVALCRGRWARYAASVAGAFLLFCFYLKWQPYFSRVLMPLFVLMAPVAAMAISRIPLTAVQVVICAMLLSNARLAVVQELDASAHRTEEPAELVA